MYECHMSGFFFTVIQRTGGSKSIDEAGWTTAQVSDAIQPSYPLLPPSPLAVNLSQYQGLFQLSTSGSQSIGALTSASVLPMNIQD